MSNKALADPPAVLVAIPVYNHGSTLRDVVTGVLAVHPAVVVIDDGSTDNGTANLADLPVPVVRHENNQGKGQAILTAAAFARQQGKTHCITLDADGQHFPADIPLFLEAIKRFPHAIILGARRFTGEHVPFSSRFGRRFSNFWLRVQTGCAVSDVQCGFRAYPVELFEHIHLHHRRYAFEVEVLVRASWAGYALIDQDIAVYYPPAQKRISHFRALRDNMDISLLNTRLTIRALIPIPHKQYEKDASGKISAIRPLRSLRILLEQQETPGRVALAAALGVILGTLPLIGLHSVAIVAVLSYMKLSKITGLAASQFCMPPFVPALCIEAGYFLRHGHFLTDISLQTMGYQALERLAEWLLGSLLLAPVLGIVTGTIVYCCARFIQSSLAREE